MVHPLQLVKTHRHGWGSGAAGGSIRQEVLELVDKQEWRKIDHIVENIDSVGQSNDMPDEEYYGMDDAGPMED